MKYLLLLADLLQFFTACSPVQDAHVYEHEKGYGKIGMIPVPQGYTRVPAGNGSFGAWLRQLELRNDNIVYLHNGQPKRNQSAQFAVMKISVGEKNLQQCADAVMRLRAEYLLSSGRKHEIVFYDNDKNAYRPGAQTDRPSFDRYLEQVFSWCGTLSLEQQLKKAKDPAEIRAGDVFIKGGSPGHAVMVIDVARNVHGKYIFMLCQSYMPAQDIHILRNPTDASMNPWYSLQENGDLTTPEWVFQFQQRRSW